MQVQQGWTHGSIPTNSGNGVERGREGGRKGDKQEEERRLMMRRIIKRVCISDVPQAESFVTLSTMTYILIAIITLAHSALKMGLVGLLVDDHRDDAS